MIQNLKGFIEKSLPSLFSQESDSVINFLFLFLGMSYADGSVCIYIYIHKPVNPEGNLPCIFFGRTDAEAEAPILWPPDVKS